jgi:hypothetical protein
VVNDPRTGQKAMLVPLPSADMLRRGAEALRAITDGSEKKSDAG